MTLKDRCNAGEAKLDRVSAALLKPSTEVLDACEADLLEVIGLLEGASGKSEHLREGRQDLVRLLHRTRMLSLQVQQAANLCQGWAQLCLGQGYTDQGRPAVPLTEPRSSYEV